MLLQPVGLLDQTKGRNQGACILDSMERRATGRLAVVEEGKKSGRRRRQVKDGVGREMVDIYRRGLGLGVG